MTKKENLFIPYYAHDVVIVFLLDDHYIVKKLITISFVCRKLYPQN